MSQTPDPEPSSDVTTGDGPTRRRRPRLAGSRARSGSAQRGVSTSRPRPSVPRRRRPRVQAPPLPTPVGSAAAGVVVGICAVVLVALGMQACEAIRDSPSCGGPGLLLLIAIVVALVVIGRALLSFVRVPDPSAVSFLGVVVSLVVVLAGFVEQTFSVWMWLVMPLLGAASFALCHLVLTASAEPDPDP